MIASTQTRPFRLGFIGLGIMGRPMVARLLARGWPVTVWNLEPGLAGDTVAAGTVWADTPRSFARQLDKDMQNLGKLSRELGLDLPLIETAIARYRTFLSQGNEFADSASISRLYERPATS
jgi:3-hydroxyisobutyrate dehydrogenase-like beta-hydroxyacid dehydrogenase